FLRGRSALRMGVAGRLGGAALLCLASGALHQVAVAPPPPGLDAAKVLAQTPGVDGQLGLLAGAAAAAWLGVRGAEAALAVVGVGGFGLLCGWSAATWRRLALDVAVAAGYVAEFGQWLIAVAWRGLAYVVAGLIAVWS